MMAVGWGSGAAVAMRILLTLFAVALLQLPYLKLLGAVLLLWIGVQLLLPRKAKRTSMDMKICCRDKDHTHRRPGDERGQRNRSGRRAATA